MTETRLPPTVLAVCLALAACTGPPLAVGPNTPMRSATAPSPLHDRQAGEGRRLEVRLLTRRDQPVVLNSWFSLQRDCSLQDYFRIALVFPPAHGRVNIDTGRFRPNYPPDTYRHDCNGEPRDGIAAIYHPASGYTGTDNMTLRTQAPSGKSWTTDFVVTVR